MAQLMIVGLTLWSSRFLGLMGLELIQTAEILVGRDLLPRRHPQPVPALGS
jgi:hypothetical protein